jgi:hypothetical protein
MPEAAILPFVLRRRASQQASTGAALVVPLKRLAPSVPARPASLAHCVAWLQEDPAVLAGRPIAVRSLRRLESDLFAGSDGMVGLHRIWRESVATACIARLLSWRLGLDAGLLVAAGLLHRLGDVWPTRQLTAEWALANAVTEVLEHWRHSLDAMEPGPVAMTPVRAVYLAHLFAVEQLYGEYCTPGLLEAAARQLGVSGTVIDAVRAEAAGIDPLLDQLA